MKTITSTFRTVSKVAVALSLIASVAIAGDAGVWLDMKNCTMCKNVSAQEGLMDNMTWEHHLTATGMMYVTVVKEGYEEKYAKSNAGMMAVQKQLMAGEKVDLCEYCIGFGSLMMSGAKMEKFSTNGGDVMLVTSTDAEIIAKIHEHGQKTIDFMANAHKGKSSDHDHSSHEGHSH